jgi:hypothetical protein
MRPSTGLSSVWREDAPGAGARLCAVLDLCLRKLGFLLEAALLPRLRPRSPGDEGGLIGKKVTRITDDVALPLYF